MTGPMAEPHSSAPELAFSLSRPKASAAFRGRSTPRETNRAQLFFEAPRFAPPSQYYLGMDTPRPMSISPSRNDATVYIYRLGQGCPSKSPRPAMAARTFWSSPPSPVAKKARRFGAETILNGDAEVVNLCCQEILAAAWSAYQLSMDECDLDPAQPLLVSFVECGEPKASIRIRVDSMAASTERAKIAGTGIRFLMATMLTINSFVEFSAAVAEFKPPGQPDCSSEDQ
jgi:hypothetical protein